MLHLDHPYLGKLIFPQDAKSDLHYFANHHPNGPFEDTFSLIKDYFVEGSVFVDVGAQFGSITIKAGKTLSELGGGSIVAIEANPTVFNCLKYNVKNVPKDVSVTVLNNGACDFSGEILEFPIPDVGKNGWTSYGSFGFENGGPRKSRCHQVESICLDDLNLKNVSVIKIDAEGYDFEVLKGAKNLLETQKPAVVVEYSMHVPHEIHTIYDWMNEVGYSPEDQNLALTSHGPSGDILFVHREKK